ncbi:MAG: T9SS type A sorting domain-containing protein [Ignavibacteria bacterium]|nr:T9SS type A sorting domain-containing protein [Ignavibacteria bacterium]
MPNEFSLGQNYPNPFNPATKIKFELRNTSFTNLVIYDGLGREVETIVNEQLNAGSYEADWNASNFPSGVYFYKLTTGDFSKTNENAAHKIIIDIYE